MFRNFSCSLHFLASEQALFRQWVQHEADRSRWQMRERYATRCRSPCQACGIVQPFRTGLFSAPWQRRPLFAAVGAQFLQEWTAPQERLQDQHAAVAVLGFNGAKQAGAKGLPNRRMLHSRLELTYIAALMTKMLVTRSARMLGPSSAFFSNTPPTVTVSPSLKRWLPMLSKGL